MKKSRLLGALCAVLFALITVSANAALFSRLGGQAAYADVLNITWTTNAALSGADTWNNQVARASNLDYLGFDDWRLASMSVAAGLPTGTTAAPIDCRTATELACRDNELGYMFYQNLGGSFGDNPQGNHTIGDVTLINVLNGYWSGTDGGPPGGVGAWLIGFSNGSVAANPKSNTFNGWAVHDGDVTTDDSDSDGIVDLEDNCIDVPNGPLIPDAGSNSQLDTDDDGYGNMCDGDLTNDGSTNTLDLNLYKLAHRTSPGDASYNVNADFNGDVVINTLDLNIYKGLHRKPPGPSCCAP